MFRLFTLWITECTKLVNRLHYALVINTMSQQLASEKPRISVKVFYKDVWTIFQLKANNYRAPAGFIKRPLFRFAPRFCKIQPHGHGICTGSRTLPITKGLLRDRGVLRDRWPPVSLGKVRERVKFANPLNANLGFTCFRAAGALRPRAGRVPR